MRHGALFAVLFVLVDLGCASHMNSNLLQARVRDQALQLTESEREIAQARSELSKSRLEIERMKSELASLKHDPGDVDVVQASGVQGEIASQISKLHIYSMASGGLNRDDRPGDDAVAIQFAPLDQHGNPVKLPGELEIALIDPRLPKDEQELGRWKFSADECQKQWTRGVTSTGYQFTVPLDPPADHANLVVQLRYLAADDREFRASRIVKVTPATQETKTARHPIPKKVVTAVADNPVEDVPPAGIFPDEDAGSEFSEDDLGEVETLKTPRESVLRDSTNWTDASLPIIR